MTESELPPERAGAGPTDTPAAADPHTQRVEGLIDRLPGRRLRRATRWLRKPSSRWVRLIAGPLLIGGGFLGPLPLFGVWMLPLGLILLSEDVPALRKATDRLLDWVERRRPDWLHAKTQPSASQEGDRSSGAGPGR